MNNTENRSSDEKRFLNSGPKKSPKRSKSGSFDPKILLTVVLIAVAVLVLVGVIVAFLIFAPSKNAKLQDNAYLLYTDSDGIYHILSNGKVVEATFTGEVTLVPAKDLSFAYVVEKTDDENNTIKMYILKGTSLKYIEITPDEVPEVFCEYTPGIIYEKDNKVHYFSPGRSGGILSSNAADAKNFMISKDANVVVFNDASPEDPDRTVLKYFSKGVTKLVSLNNEFQPVAVSQDGRYVFAISGPGKFGYIEIDPQDPNAQKTILPLATGLIASGSTHGNFVAITGQNADGTEIIFCTEASSGALASFRFKMEAGAVAQKIAEGIFIPINADSSVIAPQTFLNTYFECEKLSINEEGDFETTVSTYYLDESGAKLLADTRGQFSPDQKYFYYMDMPANSKYGDLYQIDLGTKDFTPVILKSDTISDFKVVDKGNLYYIIAGDKNESVCEIRYLDPFSRDEFPIAPSAEIDSIVASANSIYFLHDNGGEAPTLYVSTNGSERVSAGFANADLANPANIIMSTRNFGYAIHSTTDGGAAIYFTSNGKNFDFVANCNSSLLEYAPETDREPIVIPGEDDEDDE